MQYFTVRDLRTYPKEMWSALQQKGELVITNNGKPTALMLDISDGDFEETLNAIRQAKAMQAVSKLRMTAVRNGVSNLTDEDIEQEITAARRDAKNDEE